jgi:hypothetical protein
LEVGVRREILEARVLPFRVRPMFSIRPINALITDISSYTHFYVVIA